jgi:hypothetical protein
MTKWATESCHPELVPEDVILSPESVMLNLVQHLFRAGWFQEMSS